MRNLVQELMNDSPNEWESILTEKYKIKIVKDGALASLKYDQIESPMREPIVQQCRGMVVDTERRIVLAWPYNKFWNLGEGLADQIDWSTARVQEKLDGSLIQFFYRPAGNTRWSQFWHRCLRFLGLYSGGWKVASSGHPTAGGSFGAETVTFAQAVWDVVADSGVRYASADTKITYMFELCAAPNRVVVRHDKTRLVMHGARELLTGRELSSEELATHAARMNCELVREFPITTAEEVLAAATQLDPIQQEGFVVVDAKFNRIKIKSPRYVILHHMKGDATPRRAIELWKTGETSELLTHFPEMSNDILPTQAALDQIAQSALDDFVANYPQPTRKAFAILVKDRPWAAVLFKLIDREPSLGTAKSIMRSLSVPALERLLEVDNSVSI